MSDRRVALITGASRGLGPEIARQLGQQGITVVLAARDEEKLTAAVAQLEAEGIDAHAFRLDVTDADAVASLPDYFRQRHGRLDILINNAGIELDREGDVTIDTLRRTYETNVLAPFAITQALLPLLRESPAGRIVNHSSILGSLSIVGNPAHVPDEALSPAYCSSKSALNMLTVVQARQLAGTAIKVNAAHPGWVKTDMGTEAAEMEIPDGAKTAVTLALLPEDGPTGGFFHMGRRLLW